MPFSSDEVRGASSIILAIGCSFVLGGPILTPRCALAEPAVTIGEPAITTRSPAVSDLPASPSTPIFPNDPSLPAVPDSPPPPASAEAIREGLLSKDPTTRLRAIEALSTADIRALGLVPDLVTQLDQSFDVWQSQQIAKSICRDVTDAATLPLAPVEIVLHDCPSARSTSGAAQLMSGNDLHKEVVRVAKRFIADKRAGRAIALLRNYRPAVEDKEIERVGLVAQAYASVGNFAQASWSSYKSFETVDGRVSLGWDSVRYAALSEQEPLFAFALKHFVQSLLSGPPKVQQLYAEQIRHAPELVGVRGMAVYAEQSAKLGGK